MPLAHRPRGPACSRASPRPAARTQAQPGRSRELGRDEPAVEGASLAAGSATAPMVSEGLLVLDRSRPLACRRGARPCGPRPADTRPAWTPRRTECRAVRVEPMVANARRRARPACALQALDERVLVRCWPAPSGAKMRCMSAISENDVFPLRFLVLAQARSWLETASSRASSASSCDSTARVAPRLSGSLFLSNASCQRDRPASLSARAACARNAAARDHHSVVYDINYTDRSRRALILRTRAHTLADTNALANPTPRRQRPRQRSQFRSRKSFAYVSNPLHLSADDDDSEAAVSAQLGSALQTQRRVVRRALRFVGERLVRLGDARKRARRRG